MARPPLCLPLPPLAAACPTSTSRFLTTFLPRTRLRRRMRSLARWGQSLACGDGGGQRERAHKSGCKWRRCAHRLMQPLQSTAPQLPCTANTTAPLFTWPMGSSRAGAPSIFCRLLATGMVPPARGQEGQWRAGRVRAVRLIFTVCTTQLKQGVNTPCPPCSLHHHAMPCLSAQHSSSSLPRTHLRARAGGRCPTPCGLRAQPCAAKASQGVPPTSRQCCAPTGGGGMTGMLEPCR